MSEFIVMQNRLVQCESDLTAARAEIERLTKRAETAETERDEALAQVAASYDAVAEYIETVPLEVTDRQEHAKAIRALASDHAKAALDAYGREKVREGMQRAADIARECWNDPQCEADAEYIPNAILADMETLK